MPKHERTNTQNIRNFHQGIVVIKRRARCRKVLLILDDVDDVQQLKALAIDRDSFGFGSRIVVTTRDISLLNFLNVDEIYIAEELNTDESLELFREIVRQESREDPGKRSRLWNLEDVLEVLRYGTGTEAVKGIQMNAKPFEKMDKLWDHEESVLEVQRDNMASSCLKKLKLANCSLSYRPDEIGNLISLQHLDLRQNNLITLPDRICNLTCLESLNLKCNNVSHLPTEIGNLVSLRDLLLEGTNICTLPDSINNLDRLTSVQLRDCANLQSLPKLPGGCKVFAWDCTSLESLPLELDQLGLEMICANSNKLVENDFANRLLKQLHRSKGLAEIEEVVDVQVPSMGDVPIWFPYQGEGSYISFVVPPLVKQKLLGWVICVFSHKQKLKGSYIFFSDVSLSRNKIEKKLVPFSGIPYPLQQDQMCVSYIPQGYSGWHLEGGDEVKISISIDPISIDGTVVNVRWGVDLIYEVDENITKTNENQEALIQYTSALNQNVSLPEDFSSDKKRRRTF
ncbi:hypothetical protein Vadar_017318 [Vaccinium darrowii]|uniref:Uncharacterized protein n=1 Tax=Vaccinium darrowii TaxID=229202 RepID=A0ACB7YPH8_9ERIC|nr:hypothetical protein Vadar_017318 [Vaccinium darrowii]